MKEKFHSVSFPLESSENSCVFFVFFLLMKQVHFFWKWFFDLFASLVNMIKFQNFEFRENYSYLWHSWF